MPSRRIPLLFLAAGCSSVAPATEAPRTDVVIEEPLAPSSLTALGVTEAVTGAGGERAVRAVTAELAACLKPVVEREPALTGTMGFRIDPGGSSTRPATGTLAALPAAACARDALRAVKGSGAIDYQLTFNGNPRPQPLPEGAALSEDWVAVDWSASGPDAPSALGLTQGGLRERLARCAFAAEPILNEKLWLVARVARGGAVTLGGGKPGDASDCVQRALRGTTFPDAGHDYAFSVMLRPKSEVDVTSQDATEFGLIGLINTPAGQGIPDAPWGRDDSALGQGGLGLAGIGEGGGRGEGIGLGSIGTLGHGVGTGQGFGSGNGRLGGAHRSKPASVRMGASSVAGRLPPEVIKRIVRQNFGRFRLCYENGLRNDAKLAGKVSVSFEITQKGETAKISSTSDMKDKTVVACVQKAFSGLRFPEPEGGIVKVTYPIMFSPGDDAPSSAQASTAPPKPVAPPPPRTIDGKPIAAVTLVDVEKRLVAKGFEVARVPGPADAPALFVNDESNRLLYTLTLEPEREGLRGPVCKAGDKQRQLYIRGARCQELMGPLLD